MTRAEIAKLYDDTCGDVKAAIGMSLQMGLARQKGMTAAEVKQKFYSELCKECYIAGFEAGAKVGAP